MHDVFAPARFVSSLISSDLVFGFVTFNAALVTFDPWRWAVPVLRRAPCSWIRLVLDHYGTGNGIGYSAIALARASYFPGLLTAPVLLLLARWMAIVDVRPTR